MMSSLSREAAKQSVGPGWSSLIDQMYDRFASASSEIFVSDIKEKWGLLRVSVFNADDSILDFIDSIEHQSGKICEQCGKPGTATAVHGWFLTLCSDCQKTKI